MDDPYEELKRLVDNGRLSILYIDAPPRTVSSAFFRSLAQIVPACAYEPFHFSSHGFEKGLEVLLERAKEAGVYNTDTPKPIRLVAKEIARYLPPDSWGKWVPLVDHFIAIIRDPHVQLHSLVKRAANDMFYGKYGASGLSDEQVWRLAEKIGNIFKEGGSIAGRPVSGDFDRTSWRSLSEHLATLDAHLHDNLQKRATVVDGFLLRSMPHAVMSELVEQLGIRCDAEMLQKSVSGWNANATAPIKRPDCDDDDAYRTRVNASTGYEPPLEETPPLRMFPAVFQDHLKHIALPIYVDFLRRPCRVGPRSPQALSFLFKHKIGNVTLAERNPVTAYALLASLNEEMLENSEQHKLAEQLEGLSKQFPDHTAAFRIIDEVISGY